jgi:hypothetical protein
MCCGSKRASLGHSASLRHANVARDDARVHFTYVGGTGLTVIGSTTRTQYRFEPGATIAVDRRDAYGLASVPALRREPGPLTS